MANVQPTAPPLSHEAAPLPQRRFSWLALICSAFIVGFTALILIYVVPAMEPVFMDFKIELPWPTRVFLALSRLFVDGGWIVACLLPPALGFLLPVLQRRRSAWDAADYARAYNRMLGTMIVVVSILGLIVVTYIVIARCCSWSA